MTTLLAAALLVPQASVKYWTLDDFTVAPFSVTLVGGQQDDRSYLNLPLTHCAFGQRRTRIDLVSNPLQATVVYSIGDHMQTVTATNEAVSWNQWLMFGDSGTMDIDLSSVDRFFLDCDQFPDLAQIYVRDKWGKDAANGGWLLKPGGFYFQKVAFAGSVDWKHIVYLQYNQRFLPSPNPQSYTVTRFYASLKPGSSPPASKVVGTPSNGG